MNDVFDTPETLPFTATAPYGRPSWSGLLQFSLVGIPLKAYPAVRTRDLPSGHLLHAKCGQRIRYAKQCPVHGVVDSAANNRGGARIRDRWRDQRDASRSAGLLSARRCYLIPAALAVDLHDDRLTFADAAAQRGEPVVGA